MEGEAITIPWDNIEDSTDDQGHYCQETEETGGPSPQACKEDSQTKYGSACCPHDGVGCVAELDDVAGVQRFQGAANQQCHTRSNRYVRCPGTLAPGARRLGFTVVGLAAKRLAALWRSGAVGRSGA